MQIEFDQEGDLLYIRFRDGKASRTREVLPEILVDFDADGQVLGVEVIGARNTSTAELMQVFKECGIDQMLVMKVA